MYSKKRSAEMVGAELAGAEVAGAELARAELPRAELARAEVASAGPRGVRLVSFMCAVNFYLPLPTTKNQ